MQGFFIENGRRVQPVDSVTIAGNFFDVLNNLRGFGNRYQPELAHLLIPALFIEAMKVSG